MDDMTAQQLTGMIVATLGKLTAGFRLLISTRV